MVNVQQICSINEKRLQPPELKSLDILDVSGAEDGGRTRTMVTHRRILSPVRLPIPPPRHGWMRELDRSSRWWALRDSNPRPIGYEPTALTTELRALVMILRGS